MTTPSIHFFYWADKPSPKLEQLLESAARNGISLEAIGAGNFQSRFHSSLFKQGSLYEAVKRLPVDAVVCATDGFDVFYQQDETFVLDSFLRFEADVVFSAERGYSHQYRWPKQYFDDSAAAAPYRYLNAGSVIGYAGALRQIYRPSLWLRTKVALFRHPVPRYLAGKATSLGRVIRRGSISAEAPGEGFLPRHKYTDQAEMAAQFASGRHELTYALDRRCELFWCAAFEWDNLSEHYHVRDGKLENRHTGTQPAAVHVPWARYRSEFEESDCGAAEERMTTVGMACGK